MLHKIAWSAINIPQRGKIGVGSLGFRSVGSILVSNIARKALRYNTGCDWSVLGSSLLGRRNSGRNCMSSCGLCSRIQRQA
jgi:hypothetical protein